MLTGAGAQAALVLGGGPPAMVEAGAARLVMLLARATWLAMLVARAAWLVLLVARAAWLVLLVARATRLAERRVEAREGLGRLRRGRQNRSRTTALCAKGLAHSGMPRQGSSPGFSNDGGVD